MNKNILSVIFGALILNFTAFYNKFPLLTEYSGTYIDAGFNHGIPEGKSALYGFFVAHSSWAFSIWLVVFSQAFLLSFIIFYFFRYFSSRDNYRIYYLAFLFFISFLMAASVSASTIGTGVFSGVVVLALGLLLFAENMKVRDRYVISAIGILSLGMHITNLVYAVLILFIFAAIQIKKNSGSISIATTWRRILFGAFSVLVAWFLVSGLHYGLNKGFNYVDSSVFTHMEESGSSDLASIVSAIFYKGQFFISDFPWSVRNTDSFTAVHSWFNWELREASLSQQYFRGLTFKALSYTQFISSIGCILYIIFKWIKRGVLREENVLIFCVLSFILLLCSNAFLYDGSGGETWQLMWLLALPAFLNIADRKVNKQSDLTAFPPFNFQE